MTLIELIQGWMAANTHGDEQNASLVPWGGRQLVPDRYYNRYIDNHDMGLVELVEWWLCRLYEHTRDGWHCEAVIEVLRDWEG